MRKEGEHQYIALKFDEIRKYSTYACKEALRMAELENILFNLSLTSEPDPGEINKFKKEMIGCLDSIQDYFWVIKHEIKELEIAIPNQRHIYKP